MVAEVTYPEGAEQSVPLPTPVNLTAGQVYILGIGVSGQPDDGDNTGVTQVLDFDPSTIAGPDNLMSTWIAPPDVAGEPRSIRLGGLAGLTCGGTPSRIVGGSGVLSENSSGVQPAIGFAYTTSPEPTTTTTAPEPTTTTTPTPGPTTTTPAGPPVTPRYTG